MSFTANELYDSMRQYLDEDGVDYDYFCNYGHYYKDHHSFDLPDYGTVTTVEGQGMHEVVNEYAGSYTDWEVYFVVEVDDRYFKFSGTDSSWDSPGIENVEEVNPVEKTVTVWETV